MNSKASGGRGVSQRGGETPAQRASRKKREREFRERKVLIREAINEGAKVRELDK